MDDILWNPLRTIARVIVFVPALLFLLLFTLISAVYKLPYGSYMAMSDSLQNYRQTLKQGLDAYDADDPQTNNVNNHMRTYNRRQQTLSDSCDNWCSQCWAEIYCFLCPIFFLIWALTPIFLFVTMLFVGIIGEGGVAGACNIAFGGDLSDMGARLRVCLQEADKASSSAAVGDTTQMRLMDSPPSDPPPPIFGSAGGTSGVTMASAPPAMPTAKSTLVREPEVPIMATVAQQPLPSKRTNSPPSMMSAAPSNDAEMARMLQREEEARAQSDAYRRESEERARLEKRQEDLANAARKAAAGIAFVGRLGLSAASFAAKEAHRVYQEGQAENRRQQQQGAGTDPPVAVAYPINNNNNV